MIVGVPNEIKDNEYRVALTPGGAHLLVDHGHTVVVETGAGTGSSFLDREYAEAGCEIAETAKDTWGRADMVVKVKEPQPSEYEFMRDDLLLFTYLHLAAEERLTKAMPCRSQAVTGCSNSSKPMP